MLLVAEGTAEHSDLLDRPTSSHRHCRRCRSVTTRHAMLSHWGRGSPVFRLRLPSRGAAVGWCSYSSATGRLRGRRGPALRALGATRDRAFSSAAQLPRARPQCSARARAGDSWGFRRPPTRGRTASRTSLGPCIGRRALYFWPSRTRLQTCVESGIGAKTPHGRGRPTFPQIAVSDGVWPRFMHPTRLFRYRLGSRVCGSRRGRRGRGGRARGGCRCVCGRPGRARRVLSA